MRKSKFRHTITGKLVILLVLLIAPFNLIALYIASQSIRNAYRQTELTMESLTGLTMQQLDDRIDSANNFLYTMLDEREDFDIFSSEEERDGQYYLAETSLAKYLSSSATNGTSADGYFWYSPKYEDSFVGMAEITGKNSQELLTIKEEIIEWLKESVGKGYARWAVGEIDGLKWLVRVCVKDGFYYGGLFSLENLKVRLENSCGFCGAEIAFETTGESGETPVSVLSAESFSGYADLKLSMTVPKTESYQRLSSIQILSVALVCLYLLLIPVLILNLNRIVVRPLKELRDAMQRLKGGEQDYRIPVKRSAEEIEVIDETFNAMADRIQTLKIENYEKEPARQKVELSNLQLQIRPHFLMNMFNMLYSFAQIESYQSIQKLALYLSDYFRHIFKSGKALEPFEKEYGLIQQYLDISAMRYPNWYEVVYEVEPEALEVEVPPLLIHNFVENIFKHVVNYEKKIHIRLEAYTTPEEAVFIIADDGPGMEPELVENINAGIFPKDSQGKVHVGIANSYRRIHYFYGEKGKLSVESEPGEGACFTIVIPKGEET